jgi:hypothetical protein
VATVIQAVSAGLIVLGASALALCANAGEAHISATMAAPAVVPATRRGQFAIMVSPGISQGLFEPGVFAAPLR